MDQDHRQSLPSDKYVQRPFVRLNPHKKIHPPEDAKNAKGALMCGNRNKVVYVNVRGRMNICTLNQRNDCLCSFVPMFSWKTKQDSEAVAWSAVRSFNCQKLLDIISVSRKSSGLETFTFIFFFFLSNMSF